MNLDTRTLQAAAFSADVEAEIVAEVDAAIAENKVQAVWALVSRLALLSTAAWGATRDKLRSHFGTELSIRHLDRAIRKEQPKYRTTLSVQRSGSLPVIVANGRQLRDISSEALAAFQAANQPPRLFACSGRMVAVGKNEKQRLVLCEVSEAGFRGEFSRSANYIRVSERSQVEFPPPMDAVRDIMALPPADWGFPALDAIVEAPTIRQDGSIVSAPGYDLSTLLFYAPDPELRVPPIPERPTREQINGAVRFDPSTARRVPVCGPRGRRMPEPRKHVCRSPDSSPQTGY